MITAGNGANAQSAVKALSDDGGFCIQAVYTGTITATAKLMASNDGTNYSDVPDSSVTIAAAGNYVWNVTKAHYKYVKFDWSGTGGSGTRALDVSFRAQGRG
jgi:hypothetical protein